MQERTCPTCGARFTPDERARCPQCGRRLETETAAAEESPALSPGEPTPSLSTAAERPTVPPPPESPMPPPAAPRMPGPPVDDGQFRCPHCGEALYRGEQVCWSCGKRVDEAPEPSEDVPVTVPVTAEAQPRPAPPALGWDDLRRPQEPPPAEADAMRAAWWSLGLGLAALLTCGGLSIVAPIALWLGLKATRGGAGPAGVAGMVLGALGTLVMFVILIAVILIIIGATVGSSEAPSEVLAPGGPLDVLMRSVVRCV